MSGSSNFVCMICYNCKDISTTALLLGSWWCCWTWLSLFSQLHVSVCLGAENCWFLAALEALTFHQDILAAVVPQNQSFERKYAGIFHFRVQLLPQIAGDPQISSAVFCVTPLDNVYMVPFGQGQMARGYPSLERSPSPLPQSSAGNESSTSHWGNTSAWLLSPAVSYPYFNTDKTLFEEWQQSAGSEHISFNLLPLCCPSLGTTLQLGIPLKSTCG